MRRTSPRSSFRAVPFTRAWLSPPGLLVASGLALGSAFPLVARAAYAPGAEGTGLAVVTDHAEATHAAALAARGFAASRTLLDGVDAAHAELSMVPGLASTYLLPGGATVPHGQVVKRADLAKTIARFGTEGSRPFYEGPIAQE